MRNSRTLYDVRVTLRNLSPLLLPLLRRSHEARGIIQLFFQAAEYSLIDGPVHDRCPAQYPEIFPVRMSDNRVFIIPAKVYSPLITRKGPEKRYLELCVRMRVNHPRLSLCRAKPAFVRFLNTFIQDRKFSIIPDCVRGLAFRTTFLEFVGIPCYLIPRTGIAVEINMGNNL